MKWLYGLLVVQLSLIGVKLGGLSCGWHWITLPLWIVPAVGLAGLAVLVLFGVGAWTIEALLMARRWWDVWK